MKPNEPLFPWVGDPGDESEGRPEGVQFEQVLEARLNRRGLLKGLAAALPLAVAGERLMNPELAEAQVTAGGLSFRSIGNSRGDYIDVPDGYGVSLIAKWGDSLSATAPIFNINSQTAAAQSQQFGYNCDWLGYYPLPDYGSNNNTFGLLAVNFEYTNPELMFRAYNPANTTKEIVDTEIAAHGMAVIEVRRNGNVWEYNAVSSFNRRITGETENEITGPARGHELMRTSADPSGTRVKGMLNNCGGGKTPWGTVLTAEENFNQYFANRNALPDGLVKTAHARYGLTTGASERRWETFHDRFDLAKEPNESFRFGWIVEFDPYDPNSVPKKRTALGRTKHEAATIQVGANNRLAVYSGDDERFDYVYKFVPSDAYNATNRQANFNLLDEGTLYVARFNDDGTGVWLPLVQGQGPLTAANGFNNQGDVVIRCRQAADLLQPTQMDRPEDIEPNPRNGHVFILLTNNSNRSMTATTLADGRTAQTPNASNPRANNRAGHIIELTETNNDPTSTTFRWEIFVLCGEPTIASQGAKYGNVAPERNTACGAPDNIAFDSLGNAWVATDGLGAPIPGVNDGIFAFTTEGVDRGWSRRLVGTPLGAEMCGPEFTPDNETLFCAIQHPGEGGTFGGAAPLVSSWPEAPGNAPRPAILAIVKTGSGSKRIGS